MGFDQVRINAINNDVVNKLLPCSHLFFLDVPPALCNKTCDEFWTGKDKGRSNGFTKIYKLMSQTWATEVRLCMQFDWGNNLIRWEQWAITGQMHTPFVEYINLTCHEGSINFNVSHFDWWIYLESSLPV